MCGKTAPFEFHKVVYALHACMKTNAYTNFCQTILGMRLQICLATNKMRRFFFPVQSQKGHFRFYLFPKRMDYFQGHVKADFRTVQSVKPFFPPSPSVNIRQKYLQKKIFSKRYLKCLQRCYTFRPYFPMLYLLIDLPYIFETGCYLVAEQSM